MHPLRVLVVDDEPLIGIAVARALGDRASVRFMKTADAALRECEHEIRVGDVDVAFIDLWMPGPLDGIDFYRHLRLLGPRTPAVVFMTGDSKAANLVREQLRTVCIDKPFDRETLLRAMERAAAQSHELRKSGTYRRF